MSESLHFYKFRPINKRLIDSIFNRTIFAPKPEKLNDPFDCQVDIENIFLRAIDAASGKQLEFIKSFYENADFMDNWRREISTKGIYSFSLINDEVLSEPLMWSHYADEHKGVCLEYVLTENFIREDLMNTAKSNGIVVANKVDYQGNSFVDSILNAPQEIEDFTKTLLCKYLLTKSPSWKYEHEGRLVLRQSGIINLPNESLHRVYFGLRSSHSDINLVTELARSYSGCNSFFQAMKGKGDYDLNFKEIVA